MADQAPEQRPWIWSFDALCRPKPGVPATVARLRGVKVAESILYNEGEALAWLFTSKDTGEVLTKHRKRLKLELIVENLLEKAAQDAAAAGARPSQTHAVAVRTGSDSSTDVKAKLLTPAELEEKGKEGGGLTGGLLCLQLAVHPRGGGGTRYRCEAVSTPDGFGYRYNVEKLVYFGAADAPDAPHPRSTAGGALGVGHAFKVKCTANALNGELARRTALVIQHLREVKGCRIVKLSADYLLPAATDEPTLVSLPKVMTLPLPPPPPKLSGGGGSSSASLLHGSSSSASMVTVPTDPATIKQLMHNASSVPYPLPDTRETPMRTSMQEAATMPLRRSASAVGTSRASRPSTSAAACHSGGDTEPSGGGGGAGGAGGGEENGGSRPRTAGGLYAKVGQPCCYRPTPWLRLHPSVGRAVPPEKKGQVQGKKLLACCGDFCHYFAQLPKPAKKGEEEEAAYMSKAARRQREKDGGDVEHGDWVPPPDDSGNRPGSGKGHSSGIAAGVMMVPYRSILQAKAEHAVANSQTTQGPSAAGFRSTLLLQGKPGRPHPQGPVLPKPTEFYADAWVCRSCYEVYTRLDAARANTVIPIQKDPNSSSSSSSLGGLGGSSMSNPGSRNTSRAASPPLRTSQSEAVLGRGGVSGGGVGGSPPTSPKRAASSSALHRTNKTAGASSSGSLATSSTGPWPKQQPPVVTRRKLNAPERLAQINRYDGLGPKQVKRLLAELERRPIPPLPPVIAAATKGPASYVSKKLGPDFDEKHFTSYSALHEASGGGTSQAASPAKSTVSKDEPARPKSVGFY